MSKVTLDPRLVSKSVHDLEISVRLANILRDTGILTVGQFLQMDRNWFLSQERAGVTTWREVCDLQDSLNGEVGGSEDLNHLRHLAQQWNRMVTMMSQRGEIMQGADLQAEMHRDGTVSIWSRL